MRFHLLLFLLFFCHFLTAQKDWVLKKNTDGIKVYYRSATDSDIKELKIETTMDISIHAAEALLTDAKQHPKWIYSCTETQVLKQVNANELYYRDLIDFPWPLSDRDVVGHLRIIRAADGSVTTINKAAPTYVAKKKNIVRIQQNEAKWVLKPLNAKQTKMTFTLKSNPGGALPAWVVNLALDRGPLETVRNFRKLAKQYE